MKRRLYFGIGIAAVASLALGIAYTREGTGPFPNPPSAQSVPRLPHLRPDYIGLVIPPNIAPLDFVVAEPGSRYFVQIRGDHGAPISVVSRGAAILIPSEPWRALLATNAGGPVYVDVFAQGTNGTWRRFITVTNQVARAPIDRFLVYRLLRPLFNFYMQLGIYQRDLSSFRQTPVLESQDIGRHCLNCHTFLNHRPDTFAFHVRGVKGPQPMLLIESNQVSRVDNTAGYLSWHPSGRLLVYSVNKLSLFLHTKGETRDVFDAKSDLKIYRVDSNTVVCPPAIGQPDWNETWPSWGPKGQYLYFCRARKRPFRDYRQIRYDLDRVRYDLARDVWGKPETLVSAAQTGRSAAQPRVSPDGRWLLFVLAPYGNFPIYQPESDLYLMDLRTRQFHRLTVNSDQADTWHCWSSNGRWVVFSSKRDNGLFAHPYFSYVDQEGHFAKPFRLPQRDPTYYDAYLRTFNLPEFVTGPIRVTPAQLARGVLEPARSLHPTTDLPSEPVDPTDASPEPGTAPEASPP